MKTLTAITQKGGSGKTTTTLNLAGYIHKYKKKKALVIDLDWQENLTSAITDQEPALHVGDLLLGNATWEEVIIPGEWVDLVPAGFPIKFLDEELNGDINILKNLLKDLEGYDYVIIDCRPEVTTKEYNAIAASDAIIVPTDPNNFGFTGIDLFESLNRYSKDTPLYSFFNRVETRSKFHDEVLEFAESSEDYSFLKAHIRNSSKLQEAISMKQHIFKTAPRSVAALDFRELGKELEKHGCI